MSRALCCDNCDATLPLNARGEHVDGEESAWLRLTVADETYDLCTRSCVLEFVERPEVVAAHDGWVEAITGVARAVRGEGGSE